MVGVTDTVAEEMDMEVAEEVSSVSYSTSHRLLSHAPNRAISSL